MKLNVKIDGYKTYMLGVGAIMWALGGMIAGKVDVNIAIQTILGSLTAMGIRHGVEKNKAVT